MTNNDHLIGTCLGTMRHGTSVQFWCESRDGGCTDTRIITVTFPNGTIAAAVADAAAHQPSNMGE